MYRQASVSVTGVATSGRMLLRQGIWARRKFTRTFLALLQVVPGLVRNFSRTVFSSRINSAVICADKEEAHNAIPY